MTYMALDFIEQALRGLKYQGEFEAYKTPEDIKESWIDDLKTIKAYAEAILSMFESGRLKVRDVKFEEEE